MCIKGPSQRPFFQGSNTSPQKLHFISVFWTALHCSSLCLLVSTLERQLVDMNIDCLKLQEVSAYQCHEIQLNYHLSSLLSLFAKLAFIIFLLLHILSTCTSIYYLTVFTAFPGQNHGSFIWEACKKRNKHHATMGWILLVTFIIF